MVVSCRLRPMPDRGWTDAATPDAEEFLAELGAAMVAANYPINLVRSTLRTSARAYGVPNEQFLALPSYVLSGHSTDLARITRPGTAIRYDQTFPLSRLVKLARTAAITPERGRAELDTIRHLPIRTPGWARIGGYAVRCAGLALVVQPTPAALAVAAVLGLLVGVLRVVAGNNDALQQLLPTICAFLVALVVFTAARHGGLDDSPLRVLAPPLAVFLPGTAITVAVVELSYRELISGASRLIAGIIQIVQLAFGILAAVEISGGVDLANHPANRLGAWAPWLGVAVYAIGLVLDLAPPRSALPWMLAMLYAAYAGQRLGAVLGIQAGGFTGGVVLTVAALTCAGHRGAPSAITILWPGFWLLVPGSLGMIGITELVGNPNGNTAFLTTLITVVAISLGIQTALLAWRSAGLELR